MKPLNFAPLEFEVSPPQRLVVVAFVLLSCLYSVVMPIFEASDELSHFAVVKHIADGLGLPAQRPGVKTAWEQEGSQPPLYYLLVSPIARWIDTSDVSERLRYNPHAQPGDPYLYANRNLVVHSDAENAPWQATTLAVHLIRFVSILMGTATVVLVGVLMREIAPGRPDLATGAMAIAAFTPMFLFITASVNNDNLLILASTIALVLTMRILNERRYGSREAEPGKRRWLVRRAALAMTIGLAALSKVSGLTLLVPAAIALSVVHLPKREWARWVGSGLMLAAGVALIAGWWHARNYELYGEWLGIETMADIAGRRSMTLLQLIPEFEGFKIAYWALFGAVNILTLPLAYVFYDVLTVLAALGVVLYIRRVWREGDRSRLWAWLVLALYVLTIFVGVVRWTSITPASQGRLLFLAIGAISALIWMGWDAFVERVAVRFSTRPVSLVLKWCVPIVMFLIALRAPFADMAPTYAAVRYIERSDLPADMQTLNVTFDDRMRLLGVVPFRRVDSNGQLRIMLYWQCLVPMETNYSVSISAKGRGLAEIGKIDAYPHRGLLATGDCPAGAIFADEYRIPLDPDAQRPALVRAHVNLIDWSRRRWAALADGAGNPIPALIFDASALPSPIGWPAKPALSEVEGSPTDGSGEPAVSSRITFGDVIQLDGYELNVAAPASKQVALDLHWSALQRPPEDYTVFVHLLDSQGLLITQWDSQPLNGDYPTSWWQPGETVLDTRILPLPDDLPAGAYRLAIGLYRSVDGTRLPVRDAGQNPMPDNRVLIGLSLP
ncbi:MAG TPA: glycosyltransferase family 39 protein [Anaerolineae bacterium]|nr:glycosyltransferase family 39 protein [Anaerolineae bacterium]